MKALSDDPALSARHPIAVVSERTGLSQDVLRVWERRYGAVHPARAANAQRLYSDADVERLTMLHAATQGGRSIGQVAALSTAALAALVREDDAARPGAPELPPAAFPPAALPESTDVVGTALALARALDASRLDEVLRRSAAQVGSSTFLEAVAVPLLRRVGDEWHAGRLSPAVEHLVSSTLHDIIVETMRAFTRQNGAPTILVATPAGDRHAIGAALVGAAAAVEGWRVLYLGADLPADEIAAAARSAAVRIVALSVVYMENRERVLGELRALRAALPPDVALVVGGAGAAPLAPELARLGVLVQSSLAGLVTELRRARGER